MQNGNTEASVTQTPPPEAAGGLDAALEAFVASAAPGDRLPSVRELMAAHRAGPATVQRAVQRLVARGLVEARPGRGTFVSARPAPAAEPPDLDWQSVALGSQPPGTEPLLDLLRPAPAGSFVLSTGYLPAELQPTDALARALARAARRPGAWDRVPPEGTHALRSWFAAEVGGAASHGDVIVCPGGQAALTAALRGLGRPGDPLVVESPTYVGALLAARAAHLQPVPVPSDRDGIRPDLLADALQRSRARLVYLQPTYANPHGATLARERRHDVLQAVRDAGAFLIEDDAFRDLSLGLPPPPTLFAEDRHGHVVYLRSLTKPAAPGLRVGAMLVRGPAFARLRMTRILDDFYVSGALQEAAVELVTAPAWPRHLKRARQVLKERRDALLAAARHEGLDVPAPPQGGLHAWVRLPDGADDVAVAADAIREGVIAAAGRPYFPAEPPGPYMRLTFSYEPPARLAEAVRRLSGAVRPS